MKFVLLIIVPIVVAVLVGIMTKSWIWGVVTVPVSALLMNWLTVWLFGHPDDKELRRITNRPISEDLSKEELSLEARQIASKFGFKSTNSPMADPLVQKEDISGNCGKQLNWQTHNEQTQKKQERHQLLEECLQPETWHFLASIMNKALQGDSFDAVVPTDPKFHVQFLVDKLRESSLMVRTSIELTERWSQAGKIEDHRQALGWITWHLILLNYEKVRMPERGAEIDKQTAVLFKMVAAISVKAIDLKDWDTLLLHIGIFEWSKMRETTDELLRILYDKVDKEEIYKRLYNLECHQRMEIERFLAFYSRCALTHPVNGSENQ